MRGFIHFVVATMNLFRTRLACAALLCATLGIAEAADTASSPLQLPRLALSWSCKDKACTRNEKVAPLIEQAYAAAAAKGGYAVSETDSAAFEITDFRQRSPGTRVMLGLFAGKDRLAVHGNYHGKDVAAEDSSGNVVQGMDHLCASVGRKVYAAVLAQAREDRSAGK